MGKMKRTEVVERETQEGRGEREGCDCKEETK